MSGRTAARALERHFEEIRRQELARLRKKLAPLTDEQRADVDRITAQIVRAIVRRPTELLGADRQPALARAVQDLFALRAAPSVD